MAAICLLKLDHFRAFCENPSRLDYTCLRLHQKAQKSPEWGGGAETARRARSGLALRGSGQLGPDGPSRAGHKRRRQGANDIGNATSGSSGEAVEKEMAKLETTSTGGTGGSSDGSSNGGAGSAGGQRGPRGQARLGLALRGSGQLGPNGLSGAQAEATRNKRQWETR
jgi:hypothetical protein